MLVLLTEIARVSWNRADLPLEHEAILEKLFAGIFSQKLDVNYIPLGLLFVDVIFSLQIVFKGSSCGLHGTFQC